MPTKQYLRVITLLQATENPTTDGHHGQNVVTVVEDLERQGMINLVSVRSDPDQDIYVETFIGPNKMHAGWQRSTLISYFDPDESAAFELQDDDIRQILESLAQDERLWHSLLGDKTPHHQEMIHAKIASIRALRAKLFTAYPHLVEGK